MVNTLNLIPYHDDFQVGGCPRIFPVFGTSLAFCCHYSPWTGWQSGGGCMIMIEKMQKHEIIYISYVGAGKDLEEVGERRNTKANEVIATFN